MVWNCGGERLKCFLGRRGGSCELGRKLVSVWSLDKHVTFNVTAQGFGFLVVKV